jgi:cobalt-zinc-cadmium resistance protein CzcA
VVVVVAVILLAFGLNAARKLSVDAFPDVTNVQVQIATEAKGRSPEEVERFVTVPLEISMTGLPGLEEMRSLNKPGLSLITLVFTDATDVLCPPAGDGAPDRGGRPHAGGRGAGARAGVHRPR